MSLPLSISAPPSVGLRHGVGWNWADFLGKGMPMKAPYKVLFINEYMANGGDMADVNVD